MKNRSLKFFVSLILILIVSCNEPETVVTNIIHADGSVTRRIEMKNTENKFEISNIQVPFDTTWIVIDSLEISENGDSTWVKRAEKYFKNNDEINLAYLADSGANKSVRRRTEFSKKFMWFYTEYRFAEIIEKTMLFGYPVSDFLNNGELQWFYFPEKLIDKKMGGSDSLEFRALNDSVDKKIELWQTRSMVSEWIGTFKKLAGKTAGRDLSDTALKGHENEFIKIITGDDKNFDTLWTEGNLLKELIGEANFLKYKTEADSSVKIVSERSLVHFSNYIQRAVMPGKLIGTNGFIDSSGVLMWPVKSDYFLTEPYEMWVESKTTNKWTWVVTGVILLSVIAGLMFRTFNK